ncbi:hypothetical protein B0H63DRAFT_502867 [Podospora didyma]|uniref:CBM1 domain-containing protein n=1 Tax=Podospora didyma TaxID=330526 RepID=A0AAE0KDN9_9PEZI|nr:hypothetical protein B0H63DRAFT_502867 [Podospora didyma]
MRAVSALPVFAAAVAAQATAGAYGQCGGTGYVGPSACGSGYTCTTYNPYYAQCYPGTAAATPTPTPSTASTASKSSATTSSSVSSKTGTTLSTVITTSTTTSKAATSSTTTAAGSGSTPTTLQSGWYWVRAVAAPNFHGYLQAATGSSLPSALITTASSAGQFNIISGQLVWNRFPTGSAPYYLQVENVADKTQRTLKTWFAETKNTYGTFAFQGDTLAWTTTDIARPNSAAWLVCGDTKELFINTGAYLYNTPAGCADQTIHSYGGATADV